MSGMNYVCNIMNEMYTQWLCTMPYATPMHVAICEICTQYHIRILYTVSDTNYIHIAITKYKHNTGHEIYAQNHVSFPIHPLGDKNEIASLFLRS